MDEIRKALDDAYEWGKREANTPYPCSDNIRTEYEGWRDGLRLPPPDGETRGDGGPPKLDPYTEGYEDCGAGRPNKLVPGSRPPAPSSEKALREALRLLERWYTWQAEATEVRMADGE